MAESPLEFNRGLHACIAVKNMDASIQWYRRVLGFELFQSHEYEAYSVRVVYLRRNGIELELVQPPHAGDFVRGDPPAGHVAEKGITQLSLRVNDMEHALAALQALQVKVIFGPVESPEFNLKACFIRDLEGNLIELIQRN